MIGINFIVAMLTITIGSIITRRELKALYDTVFETEYISLGRFHRIMNESGNDNCV